MVKRTLILLGHAIAVWAFCGALVGVGRPLLGMDATLVVHALGAPVGAGVVAWLYFRNHGFTGPMVTAATFVATALVLDLLVVAPLVEHSFAMFSSVLGVWLPMALIFAATWATGRGTLPPRP